MLNVELLPKQWEVFNPQEGVDFDIALYQGGVGSGKTFLGTLKGLRVLSQNPGATWLVGADTYSRLAISTCDTYEQLLDDANIRYKFNRSDHIIRIPGWDNARILFKGLDDPLSLRSVNGIGGHLEEASLLSESAFLEFLGRLRQAKPGTPIEVILTTNPQTVKGWLHESFVEGAGVSEETIRGNTIKVNRRRVIARTLDNPYVSDAFIASLRRSYDEKLWDIMVLGEDGDYTAGLVCYNWSDANIEPLTLRPNLPLYLSCDFNIDPNSWAVAQRYNGEYFFLDEVVLENKTTSESAEEFYRRYKDHKAGVRITGDASGKNRGTLADNALETNYTILRNRLQQLGIPNVDIDIRSSNPAIDARTAAWNGAVCNSQGVRRIKVDPKCKWLIWNCQNLKYIQGTSVIWEPTRNQIEKDPKLKFTKHIWDAASYLVERYDPIRLDIPASQRPRVATQQFKPSV